MGVDVKRSTNFIAELLDRWQPPEQLVILISAVVVGAGTGLGAVFFIWLMGRINELASRGEQQLGSIVGLLVVLGVAGFAVGYMVDHWAREAKGHGVPEVMEAMIMRGGRIRPPVAVVKVLASSLTIGAGGSAGREGPIVQVGSALGSTLGQVLQFSNERIRTLVACGAAAGISATFNAPIAGSIFALEIILGHFTAGNFGAVVISSVSAGVVSRIFLGDRPAFQVPAYPLSDLGELPIYVVLGVLSALVAVAFIRSLYWMEGLFDGWNVPGSLKASLGLVLTGVAALALPGREVLGPGLDIIGDAIAEDITFSIGLMAMMLVLKLVTTCFTLGSGNSGGVFAPGLFMGAILGGIVGRVAYSLWPGVVFHPGAYAIVGMAAVFAGAARAPITAVLIVFEMSNDYRLILPLMLATVLSTVLAEHLFRESIYTLKLKLKGISYQRGRDVDVLQGVTVGEVMERNVHTVTEDMTIVELSDMFTRSRSHGFPLLDKEGRLKGVVTVSDLERAVANNMPRSTRLSEIATPRSRLLVAFPDETMGEALARMGIRGVGRLPVVSREDPDRLLGLVWREAITRAYQIALARRAELQHRTRRIQLRNLDGTEFVEVMVSEQDAAAGKMVKDMAALLPHECVLISIRRDGKVIIPHGDTVFQPGDKVTAFVEVGGVEDFKRCMKSGPEART